MSRLDDDALIAALSAEARRVAKADAAGEPAPGGWHRFEARRAQAEMRALRQWPARGWVLASALMLVLGTVAGRGLWLRHSRLTFAVEGADARTDGYIPRVAAPLAQVKFSDGTEVEIEHGSRAWVVSTDADGAQLRLEDGRAHFAVVHRPHAHWLVEAGPFVVWVAGTDFDVQWSSTKDLLRVYLRGGVVTVGGPQTRGGVTLLPGQVLEARPDEGILRVEPAPAETAAPSAVRASSEKHVSGVAVPSPLAAPSTPPGPSTPLVPAAGARSLDSIARRPPEGWSTEQLPRASGVRPQRAGLGDRAPRASGSGGRLEEQDRPR